MLEAAKFKDFIHNNMISGVMVNGCL